MKSFATLFLLATSILFTSTTQAQTTFSIGPKVGEIVAKLRLDGDATTNYHYGFAAGAQACIGWGQFALQPALLFAQKGYKTSREVPFNSGSSGIVYGDYTTKLRLNYLTLPVNFTYIPTGTATGPQFFAGPYVSLLLGGHYDQQSGGSPVQSDPVRIANNTEITGDYYARRFDAGLQAGLGFRIEHLLLQIDYSLGLRDVAPTYTYFGAPVDRTAQHNSSFLAAVSYLFDVKH